MPFLVVIDSQRLSRLEYLMRFRPCLFFCLQRCCLRVCVILSVCSGIALPTAARTYVCPCCCCVCFDTIDKNGELFFVFFCADGNIYLSIYAISIYLRAHGNVSASFLS